jgi:hypothetical protein
MALFEGSLPPGKFSSSIALISVILGANYNRGGKYITEDITPSVVRGVYP